MCVCTEKMANFRRESAGGAHHTSYMSHTTHHMSYMSHTTHHTYYMSHTTRTTRHTPHVLHVTHHTCYMSHTTRTTCDQIISWTHYRHTVYTIIISVHSLQKTFLLQTHTQTRQSIRHSIPVKNIRLILGALKHTSNQPNGNL